MITFVKILSVHFSLQISKTCRFVFDRKKIFIAEASGPYSHQVGAIARCWVARANDLLKDDLDSDWGQIHSHGALGFTNKIIFTYKNNP